MVKHSGDTTRRESQVDKTRNANRHIHAGKLSRPNNQINVLKTQPNGKTSERHNQEV